MSRINIKLNEVQSDFLIVPEGTYAVEITEFTCLKAVPDKTPYILWVIKILEGDFAERNISFVISLNAGFKIRNIMEAIDVEWDDDGFDLEDIYGKVFLGQFCPRTYNDRESNDFIKAFPIK